MGPNLLPVDRDQPYLLPPSLADWLPQDHLAWFVLDVVDQIDLSAFYRRYRQDGWGGAAFDPKLMVALLLYAYCVGERSSRSIERRCVEDVAFRVIAANQVPDHTTIARFRQSNEQALGGCFVEVLKLCRAAGMIRVGAVVVDGTKVEANASMAANRSLACIDAEVERILQEAASVDAEEDAAHGSRRGDELPPELAERASRLARLRACRDRLAAEEEDRQRAHRDRLAERADRQDQGLAVRGKDPAPPRPRSVASTQANPTDPESRVMRRPHGLLQGYNAQAMVSEDRIIVAAAVTQRATDRLMLRPMVGQLRSTLRAAGVDDAVGTIVADAGYWNEREFDELPADAPALLIVPQGRPHNAVSAISHRRRAMEAAVRSPRGRALLTRRGTVEQVFAEIKWVRGARRFMRRGVAACDNEWRLLCTSYNLLRLWRTAATT